MSLSCRLALGALAITAIALAEPRAYSIAPGGQTRFELRVYKSGLMSGKMHLFRFERFEGRLDLDPADPARSSIRFSVESDSITCLDEWVSEKDRGKILDEARGNMLAVKKFPHLRFESTAFEPAGEGAYKVAGRLTIRDQTRDVAVAVKVQPDGQALVFEGEAVVSLEDYGLKPPSAALGLIGTKSEMDVSFALRAEPAKE